MPDYLSNLTGGSPNFDFGVPSLDDDANIINAFAAYHYGPNYDGVDPSSLGGVEKVFRSGGGNVKITSSSETVNAGDIAISVAVEPITLTLPTVFDFGDTVKVIQQTANPVTLTSSAPILSGSPTTTGIGTGITAICSGNGWWCLPFSSSQPTPTGGAWERPADWLPEPTFVAGETVCYLLAPIYENSGSNTFGVTVYGGTAIVDWGDGAQTTATDNTPVTHIYDYASISASTLTSEGFKQCMVEIRPDIGESLTRVSIVKDTYYQYPFIEMQITGPDINYIDTYLYSLKNIVIKSPNVIPSITSYMGTSAIKRAHLELPIADDISATFSGSTLEYLYVSPAPQYMQNMFQANPEIKEIDITYGAVNVDASRMFYSSSIYQPPMFDTSGISVFSEMFSGCFGLNTIPLYDTSNATNINSMFNYSSIRYIPALDFSNVTAASNAFANCPSLSRSDVFGLTVSHSYSNGNLSAVELNRIFTNLGTAQSGATIFISNNPGTSTCDTTIAENKGWTVVG